MIMTKFSRINKQREEITMRVLEDMEKGGNEWKKPWVEASPLPPHNPVSGTQYSGRNFLYTYVYGMMRGYADPRWATEKQIKEMGWKVPENLQNGRGGINDELGVGIEHWGMYAYIPRVKKDGTPLTDKGGTQKFTRFAPSKRTASGDATVKAITENMNSSSCRVASIRTPNAIATSRYSISHLSRASRRFPFPTSCRMTISKSDSLPTT